MYFFGWKSIYIGFDQAHFQLYWLADKQQPGEEKLFFSLVSGDSKIKIPYEPLFGRLKIHDWATGKIICDHLFINRPEIKDPGTFSVMAATSSVGNEGEQSLFNFEFR